MVKKVEVNEIEDSHLSIKNEMKDSHLSVKELVKKLEDKIDPFTVINGKYVEQNFHMSKELKLLQKRNNDKRDDIEKSVLG